MESRTRFHVCLIRKNLHVVIAQFVSQILSFSIYQGIKIEIRNIMCSFNANYMPGTVLFDWNSHVKCILLIFKERVLGVSRKIYRQFQLNIIIL